MRVGVVEEGIAWECDMEARKLASVKTACKKTYGKEDAIDRM